nr:cation-chloride cotransporter 1 [Tanacetum cinerariifolium]
MYDLKEVTVAFTCCAQHHLRDGQYIQPNGQNAILGHLDNVVVLREGRYIQPNDQNAILGHLDNVPITYFILATTHLTCYPIHPFFHFDFQGNKDAEASDPTTCKKFTLDLGTIVFPLIFGDWCRAVGSSGDIIPDVRKLLYDLRVQAEVVTVSIKTRNHKGHDGSVRDQTQDGNVEAFSLVNEQQEFRSGSWKPIRAASDPYALTLKTSFIDKIPFDETPRMPAHPIYRGDRVTESPRVHNRWKPKVPREIPPSARNVELFDLTHMMRCNHLESGRYARFHFSIMEGFYNYLRRIPVNEAYMVFCIMQSLHIEYSPNIFKFIETCEEPTLMELYHVMCKAEDDLRINMF